MQSRWAKEVNPENTHSGYPRPQLSRDHWINLNGLWNYAITKLNAPPPARYDGQILVPYPIESALSGVNKALLPDQHLWYSRNIQKPKITNDQRILLHFDAVDWQATVYLNGKEVGSHSGGYVGFTIDITESLNQENNELKVRVYDPTDKGVGTHGKQVLNPADIYYTSSSGIWQTVWMEIVPSTYIASLKLESDIENSLYSITVNTNTNTNDNLTIEAITYERGKPIMVTNGKANTKLRVSITNPHLWSPNDPFLYNLSVRLRYEGKIVDEVRSYIGMRKVEIRKDKKGVERIFLNNKYTYNLGVLDQGYWPDGLYTAPTDDALKFDVKAIKEMGFNTIRKHIKIEPLKWYYYCDSLGLMVWQDFVNPNQSLPAGAKEAFEKELQETITHLYNHPSITTWVLFNERWGAYDQERLTEWVKQLDNTRLVNGHSGELLYTDEQLRVPSENPYIKSDMADVHSYPDPIAPPAIVGKAKVLGEFGGIGTSVFDHQWNDLKGWGYVTIKPSQLAGKYEILTKKLKFLEALGLTASIYTQPFDVEGEENGLITYDREIIKIPLDRIRTINKQLLPEGILPKADSSFFLAKNMDVNDSDDRYNELLERYYDGQRDSAFLRKLTLMALRKKDQDKVTLLGTEYVKQLKHKFLRENLEFLLHITQTSKDVGFNLYLENQEKIDKIMGDLETLRKIKRIINAEEIEPLLLNNSENPNWDSIQQNVCKKYGKIGEELVYGKRMIYSWRIKKDWQNMGKFYKLYYERALKHSDYHINNISWFIFLHIEDKEILDFATKVVKYNIETFDQTAESVDTYANLLYKTGNWKEAIKWQEKAVMLSNNNDVFLKNLVKMRRGEATWALANEKE
ncbi:glycoside hydrolase family 2 protein [Olivibacter jilunii]|uniref:glycoside hydrolase family 2 protein n=1 Tax=Olivibacter jilunii TaxID=985016 RepID=UPI001A92EBE4|nr:sugar-binding domain-containing protein [Olivibacter jilunii]